MTDLTLRYTAAEAIHRPTSAPTTVLTYAAMIVDAVRSAYRFQTDREIARLIQQNGGVISDEVERRINRHLGG